MHRVFFGGGCSCCGLADMKADLSKYIAMCTDASDTAHHQEDAGGAESPWPYFIREEAWKDRVKLRAKLKKEYKALSKLVGTRQDELEKVWAAMPLSQRAAIARVGVGEIHKFAVNTFDAAYQALFLAVVEQVRNFPETGYPGDSVSKDETQFEAALSAEQKSGNFALTDEYIEASNFLKRILRAADASLLPRRHASAKSESSGSDVNADAPSSATSGESRGTPAGGGAFRFRADRRLVRHLIRTIIIRHTLSSVLPSVNDGEGGQKEKTKS